METTLTITKTGVWAGVSLSPELLTPLGVEIGGTLLVVRTPKGVQLTAADSEFERHMVAAREVMRRHPGALRELAR